jgi:hypothetical protein
MINKKKTHCQRLYQDGCLQVGDTIHIICKSSEEVIAQELYRSLEFVPKHPIWDTRKYPLVFKSHLLDLLADGQYETLARYVPGVDLNSDDLDDVMRDAIELTIDWVPVIAVWIGEEG